jgi:hypothetical protein
MYVVHLKIPSRLSHISFPAGVYLNWILNCSTDESISLYLISTIFYPQSICILCAATYSLCTTTWRIPSIMDFSMLYQQCLCQSDAKPEMFRDSVGRMEKEKNALNCSSSRANISRPGLSPLRSPAHTKGEKENGCRALHHASTQREKVTIKGKWFSTFRKKYAP